MVSQVRFLAAPLVTALVLILATVVAAIAGPVGTAFGWELSAECGPNGTVVGRTTVPIRFGRHGDPRETVFDVWATTSGAEVDGSRQTIRTTESSVDFTLDVSAAPGAILRVELSSGEITDPPIGPCFEEPSPIPPTSTPTATATATSTKTATVTATPVTPTKTATKVPNTPTRTATTVPPTATPTRFATIGGPPVSISPTPVPCDGICLPETGTGDSQHEQHVYSPGEIAFLSVAGVFVLFAVLTVSGVLVWLQLQHPHKD